MHQPDETLPTPESPPPAPPPALASVPLAPTRLGGRFEDEGEIGRGGMGSIQRLHETNLRRRVAMKVLHAEMAARPREVERFVEEARVTASLDHPNIPAVHELGRDEQGRPYFTMKLVEGTTLLSVLRDPAFSPADSRHLFDALQVLLKACDAVAFAHGRGVFHCDLKPMNIMVAAHGAVFVMDWGIARHAEARHVEAAAATGASGKHIEGTAAYMAPEQAQGRLDDIDARTDVFGLGGVLYRILAGRAPHTGELDAQLEAAKAGVVDAPWKVRRDVMLPRRLCDIAMKALAPDPADRFPTVAALRDAIEAYVRGEDESDTAVFEAGALVCREGDEGDAAWVIVEGRLRVFKTLGTGRQVLGELGPGDVFGETAILGAQIRTASVEAVTRVKARVLHRALLERELGRTFWVGQLVKSLADRFRDVNERAAKAQEERIDQDLREEILRWMLKRGLGATGGTGVIEAPWGPVRVHLCRTFARTGPETSALVQRLPGFELDLDADVLRLK